MKQLSDAVKFYLASGLNSRTFYFKDVKEVLDIELITYFIEKNIYFVYISYLDFSDEKRYTISTMKTSGVPEEIKKYVENNENYIVLKNNTRNTDVYLKKDFEFELTIDFAICDNKSLIEIVKPSSTIECIYIEPGEILKIPQDKIKINSSMLEFISEYNILNSGVNSAIRRFIINNGLVDLVERQLLLYELGEYDER